MPSSWRNFRATVPGPFLAALGVAAGFWLFVAWDQSHWWRVKDDYSFGWLVPFFVIFVVHDRWPRILAAIKACQAEGSPRVAGFHRWIVRVVVAGSLLAGTLFFLMGAFLRAGSGTTQPATLALAVGSVGILFPVIFLSAPNPAAPQPAGLFADARVRLTALFIFPVLVWLISAPLVDAFESQLSLFLLRRVVTVVAFAFDTLGLPLQQQGNVLVLPRGQVGVAEACSGIRSLTGCLFAGSFLAAVFLESGWKKIVLVVAALFLAFATNLGRSLFLTAWAYRHGPEAIEGTVHDATGYAVLGLTVVGLFCLIPLLNLRLGARPVDLKRQSAL
jgi:exosortase/archaeosortase family protein